MVGVSRAVIAGLAANALRFSVIKEMERPDLKKH
jgi:hypothetical protein